jgi:hypothetical protein
MVARRRGVAGKAHLGCLIPLALVAFAVYVGRNVPGVYWRYYQMQDEVKSQASFAPGLTDQAILERLVAQADTLGLPLGPKQWTIKRTHGEIDIHAEYEDSVALDALVWHRVLHFHFEPQSRAEL